MKVKTHFRECPNCSKQMGYITAYNRDKAVKTNSICKSCSNRKVKPGVPLSEDHKAKITLGNHKHYGTDPNNPVGKRSGHTCWAYNVKKRDKHICAYCEATNVPVEAHHILSHAKHPELALLLNNGITLCKPCHKEEHRLNGII